MLRRLCLYMEQPQRIQTSCNNQHFVVAAVLPRAQLCMQGHRSLVRSKRGASLTTGKSQKTQDSCAILYYTPLKSWAPKNIVGKRRRYGCTTPSFVETKSFKMSSYGGGVKSQINLFHTVFLTCFNNISQIGKCLVTMK